MDVIKCKLKKWSWLKRLYRNTIELYCSTLTLISPRLNTKVRFRMAFKHDIDLVNPQTLSEKLLWLKLNKYMKDPLVIQCADKYLVRNYVDKCGYGELLNELYAVYNSPDMIEWEKLPPQFALKWNFGAGFNVICSDKSQLDKHETLSMLRRWAKCKCWLSHSEMQYKYIPKKIVCEKYLCDRHNPGVIPDYKVYCFHGEPLAILVMHDRGTTIKSEFFDNEWKRLPNTNKYQEPAIPTPKPKVFEQMIDASKAFSKPFPFVRCDFYTVDDKLYFGELTFTPAGGFAMSETRIAGKQMTEYLHVN